ANFSVPLGNVKARSTVRSRALELRRAKTRLKRLEQAIILEARTAIRDLQSAREGIKAAERRRLAAEEQLRAEEVRLEYGESTPFDALQRERDLVEAESQKISALQRYRESIATLDAAQGTILEDRNILIEDTKKLR
ncbi:TolC family protein, partial [Myxococcota bacterium]|nr:TolC family protein [Myxococcota bacterium]